jgi:hypothetical protein
LVNYSLKLGWTPLFVDLDLTSNMISAPGCLSAALIDENLEGHTDNLTSKSINYYHGSCAPVAGNLLITSDLFDNQVKELADACEAKIKNDIIQFK